MAIYDDYLKDRVDVYHLKATVLSDGGLAESYGAAADVVDVHCLIIRDRDTEALEASGERPVRVRKFMFAPDADVDPHDRLVLKAATSEFAVNAEFEAISPPANYDNLFGLAGAESGWFKDLLAVHRVL